MKQIADVTACNNYASAPTCPLHELGIGCRGNVVAVGGDAELRRRLLEMGFCNGACVEVVRRAPLGDPIEFRLPVALRRWVNTISSSFMFQVFTFPPDVHLPRICCPQDSHRRPGR
jgi:ferrous iron transport protein A